MEAGMMIERQKLNRPSFDLGACVVVVIDEKTSRFALVIDRSKPEPHYWKFPGGKIDKEDVDPEHPHDDQKAADNAAVRETKEETGLNVQVMQLGKIPKKNHTLYMYMGLADFQELTATGDEGEIVKPFSLEQIKSLQALGNFFPNHLPILHEALRQAGM
jgi:8-oxo-dGTP pyrophosphatase MutT (NUDIX family)